MGRDMIKRSALALQQGKKGSGSKIEALRYSGSNMRNHADVEMTKSLFVFRAWALSL